MYNNVNDEMIRVVVSLMTTRILYLDQHAVVINMTKCGTGSTRAIVGFGAAVLGSRLRPTLQPCSLPPILTRPSPQDQTNPPNPVPCTGAGDVLVLVVAPWPLPSPLLLLAPPLPFAELAAL